MHGVRLDRLRHPPPKGRSMEIRCAGCQCVADRGVRTSTCDDAGCCCADLPVVDDRPAGDGGG
jgi:hypothetical protein